MVLKLGFGVKFVCIQNFEFTLNILEHSKPSISSLKQPDRLAACLLEKTPLPLHRLSPIHVHVFGHYVDS